MRVYVGFEHQQRLCVVAGDPAGPLGLQPLPTRTDLWCHGPAREGFGRTRASRLQVALAMCADHLGQDDAALQVYERVAERITRDIEDMPWVVTSQTLSEIIADILIA